jgi:hypothetical protein
MENNNHQVAGHVPAGALGRGPATEPAPLVLEIPLEFRCREFDIISRPMGDLLHSWATLFVSNSVPSVNDVVRVARGEWLYRTFRFSVSIRNPPVRMYLSVHTHHALHNIKRDYLYPTDFMPSLVEGAFEWAFKATLTKYYNQLAIATLPGDRVFLHLVSREPFRGTLSTLTC